MSRTSSNNTTDRPYTWVYRKLYNDVAVLPMFNSSAINPLVANHRGEIAQIIAWNCAMSFEHRYKREYVRAVDLEVSEPRARALEFANEWLHEIHPEAARAIVASLSDEFQQQVKDYNLANKYIDMILKRIISQAWANCDRQAVASMLKRGSQVVDYVEVCHPEPSV